MDSLIRVVVVPVGKDSEVREISDTLEVFREIVGGCIQSRSMGSNILAFVNEDGIELGLPQNGCGFLGSYFFTKVDSSGNSVSLSEQDCNMIRAYVAANRQVWHFGSGNFTVNSFNSWEELLAYQEQLKFDREHLN